MAFSRAQILLVMAVCVLLDAVHAIETGCQGEFEGRCRCGVAQFEGTKRYVTNCTNAGFSDASMLSQIPLETEVLIFTGNNVRTLPPNAFGDDVKYDKLFLIDLSRNNITEIQGQAFHRVPKVTRLVLNDNWWRVDGNHARIFATMPLLHELHLDRGLAAPSSPDGFQNLVDLFRLNPVRQLTKLSLRGNSIGPFLKLDIFCNISSLADINLASNDIIQVLWETPCLHRLHTLDLSDNLIQFLANSTMDSLDAIEDLTVDLSDNQFDCDCQMLPFYHWMHVTNVHIHNREGYTCKDGFPEKNAGHIVMALPPERLQCKVPLLLVPAFGFIHVILIAIIVLTCAVLVAIIVSHRTLLANTFLRVGQPVYRRMQYSAIRKPVDRDIEI